MTYAVGDVHGCFETLRKLLDKLSLTEGDELVFLGDYVDRGPNSKEVILLLEELSKHYKCVFIRGNHEEMLLNCVERGRDCDVWYFNGARTTLESFGGRDGLLKHLDFFKNTVYFYEKGPYVFVHAGVRPGIPLEEQRPFDLVWIREEFIYSENPLPGRIVVFGHTPLMKPFIGEDKIGLDTGCVYGGFLTAFRIEDGAIYQVKCSGGGWF